MAAGRAGRMAAAYLGKIEDYGLLFSSVPAAGETSGALYNLILVQSKWKIAFVNEFRSMTTNFFGRLRDYYISVASVLRGEASAASVFPNPTDKGLSREKTYAEFLKQHAPSKCNVFFGGFLFDEDGAESRQLDVIVTTDTTPRFDFHNRGGAGKAFSPVEGTLAAVSIKSKLDKRELHDALENLASIPHTRSLEGRINPFFNLKDYDDWPLKVVYATDGIDVDTLLTHISEFYSSNPQIQVSRRPNIIHVSSK